MSALHSIVPSDFSNKPQHKDPEDVGTERCSGRDLRSRPSSEPDSACADSTVSGNPQGWGHHSHWHREADHLTLGHTAGEGRLSQTHCGLIWSPYALHHEMLTLKGQQGKGAGDQVPQREPGTHTCTHTSPPGFHLGDYRGPRKPGEEPREAKG